MFIPGFANGFARNASESLNPDLWKGLVGAYAPYIGNTGQILHDWSGYRNDGALVGMTNDNWVPIKQGYALDYIPNDCVDISKIKDFVNPNQGSILTWINPDNLSSVGVVIGHFNSGNRIYIYLDASNRFTITLGSGGAITLNTLAPGGHYFLGLTWDAAGNYAAYLDGKLVSSGAYAGLASIGANFDIGCLFVAARQQYFDGRIGQTLIYDRSLLQNEIVQFASDEYSLFKMPRMTFGFSPGRISRYYDLSGLGGQGQMTWNPLG